MFGWLYSSREDFEQNRQFCEARLRKVSIRVFEECGNRKGQTNGIPGEVEVDEMEEEVIKLDDGTLCIAKKYADGTYATPTNNDFDYQLEIGKLMPEIESEIYKHNAESKRHIALKKAAYVFILDKWGLRPCEVQYELTDKSTPRKLRPDISCRLPHIYNAKVAIECGTITYRNKLEDLVTKCGFDSVVWIPTPENPQMHYIIDVEFLTYSCHGIGDFKMGKWPIDYAKINGKVIHLKYSDIDASMPDDDVVVYFLFRKSFPLNDSKSDGNNLKRKVGDAF